MARRTLSLLTVVPLAAIATRTTRSADEGTIAFQSTRADGNMEIHVMDGDGTHIRRLTHSPAYDYAPAWSPDGRRIAFMSDRAGPSEIHLMRADGSQPHRFSHSTPAFRAVAGFAFHPLTGRLTFRAEDAGGAGDVFVSRLDGGGRRSSPMLPRGPRPGRRPGRRTARGSPTCSAPRGRQRPVGHARRRHRTPADHATAGVCERGPAWSPDGRRLAFASGAPGRAGRIEIMRADGSRRRAVTAGARDATPAWSPDGTRLAFTRETTAGRQIQVVDADGGVPLGLTAEGDNAAPSWVGRRPTR